MAVDTRAKRFSVMGFGGPVPAMVFDADGTVGASDRADLLFLYAGIALAGAPTGRIMSSLAGPGGLVSWGGLASKGGGLAG